MERTSILKGIALTLALFLSVAVFGATHKQRLYQCYLTGNMADWLVVMDELSSEYNRTKSVETLFELTHAQYGYIGYLLGVDDEDRAEKFLEKANYNIDILLNKHPRWVEALALKGAFIAYRIAISPYKAPFIGPESIRVIDKALAIDSSNPYALNEKANAKLYAPLMFGGNPQEAVLLYMRALKSIEKSAAEATQYEWWHLNVMAQLAIAAEKSGQVELARSTYKRILHIAPEFKWVRDELYAKFKKRHG
ncbi:MAG: hypothetical protein JW783_07435 [Bacteroidales bacterium]|nr:hypothetical protein [Bacteroidales bacterium]MBN2748709.1 hypothetical protein [Bacteroidales bacterium]